MTVRCGGCGHEFPWDLWLMVDGRDRPDLETRFVAGELDEVVCPKCSERAALVGPSVLLAADGLTFVRSVGGDGSDENAAFIAHLMERADDPDELRRRLAKAKYELVMMPEPPGLDWLRDEIIRAASQSDRYLQSGDARDLAEATVAWKNVVASAAFAEAPRPLRADVYNSLALCHQRRYLATADDSRADLAQESWAAALDECDPGTEAYRAYASNAGLARAERYERTHDGRHLDESIRLHKLACESGCRPGAGLGDSLRNLSAALFARFELIARKIDLDDAIARLESGLEMLPSDDARRPELLTNLGVMLLRRGDVADLAVATHRKALQLPQVRPNIRPVIQSNLAQALLERNRVGGRTEDLSEAVSLMRKVVSSPSLTNEERLSLSTNLGVALIRKYHLGDAGALDEATGLFDEADHAGNPSQLTRARAMLGRAMSENYRVSGRPELLDRAVYLLRLAATNCAEKDPQRSSIFHSLGIVLDERHDLWERPEDLAEALNNLQRARDLSVGKTDHGLLCSIAIVLRKVYRESRDDEHLATLLSVANEVVEQSATEQPREQAAGYLALAGALHAEYGAKKDLDVLRRSIARAEQAISLAEPDQLTHAYASLARKLRDLYAEEPTERSLHLAIEAYRSAITNGLERYPERALHTAVGWSAWALSRASWLEAAEGALLAIRAADLLDARQTLPEHRGHWIEVTAEAYEALAYALARSGDLSRAVEVLENGRAHATRRSMQRSAEIEDPSAARSFKDVQQSASEVLVYLTTIPQGGMALIVEPTGAGDGVRALWLDAYSDDIARALFIEDRAGNPGWLTGYHEWQSTLPAQAASAELLETLSRTLEVLWSAIMGPLSRELRSRGTRYARVFPSPALSLLPLQAASDTHGRAVIDDLVIAYAPHAITQAVSDAGSGTSALFAVADDRSNGPLPDLPCAVIETEIVSGHFENHRRLNVSSASIADVEAALSGADTVHFACHGRTDQRNPMLSSLAVAADGELTLDRIVTLAPRRRRLAILAGCETGLASLSALHRGASLAAAFFICGTEAVIGTFWVIPDWCSALMLCRLFDEWPQRNEPLAPAFARTQLWMRDRSWIEKLSYLRDGESAKQRLADVLEALPEVPDTSHPFYWAAFRLLES